jgi:hypothetical protein
MTSELHSTVLQRTADITIKHRFKVGDTVKHQRRDTTFQIEGLIFRLGGVHTPMYVTFSGNGTSDEPVSWVDKNFELTAHPRSVVAVDSGTEVWDGYETTGYISGQSRSALLTLHDGTKVFATQPAMTLIGDIIPSSAGENISHK